MKWLVWLAVLLPWGAAVASEHYIQAWQPQEGAQFADTGLTLEEAIARVRQHYGGRVISATPIKDGKKTRYRIRIDVGGRVKNIDVDDKGRFRGR